MSPEMLMQPFEQSFNPVQPSNYFQNHLFNNDESAYFLAAGFAHQQQMDPNGDFRPSFYNPFEIKHRRRTSRAQLKVLESSFSGNPKPNATVRRYLAQKLDMTPRGVQIWFQNRRAKAKLQRRKSGQDEESSQQQDQQHQQHQEQQQQQHQQQESPVLFTQFFNNLKNWENSARSIATAAAASCIFDNNTDNNLMNNDHHQQQQQQLMMTAPLHPLTSIAEQPYANFDDWRRRSCPTLNVNSIEQSPSCNYHIDSRRMTSNDISGGYINRFNQSFNMTTKASSSECGTPRWSKDSPALDFYSNLNYSPMPQQLTPMLSTGSPVSSIDGGYYDSCLDLLMTCSPKQ